jgi:hypothetical protein
MKKEIREGTFFKSIRRQFLQNMKFSWIRYSTSYMKRQNTTGYYRKEQHNYGDFGISYKEVHSLRDRN